MAAASRRLGALCRGAAPSARGGRRRPSFALADVLLVGAEERRERAVDVAQPHAAAAGDRDDDLVGADRRSARCRSCRAATPPLWRPRKLIMSSWSMPSPETPMPPTSVRAAVDRHRAREDLDAVGEPAGRGDRAVQVCGVSALPPRTKPTWCEHGRRDQRRLQAGREGIELGDRPRERARAGGRPRRPGNRAARCCRRRGRRRRSGRSARSGSLKKARARGDEGRHVGVGIGRAARRPRTRLEKKVAVRAFCSETSMPKIGASGARTMPSTAPLVSTTEIVTCARLSSGRRIWARARAHDLERFLEHRADLGGGERLPPAASVPARIGIAVRARAVGEDDRRRDRRIRPAVARRMPEASVP